VFVVNEKESEMEQLVAGQRAMVTGGGTGLGFATAKRLLEHAADVLICSRQVDVLEASAARLEKHAVPYMKEHGGSMVTMSSTAGIKVEQWMSAYSTSKAAVEMLTKCAAFELAPFKIRVNGIRPGWHTTESNLRYCPPDFQEYVIGRTLMGRPGEPEEIGDAIVWLASPMASFVTGQIIGIDGGLGVDMGENFESMVRGIHGDEVMDAAMGRGATTTTAAGREDLP
jgi:NAD(P)-dependent dehydrogenase (short-subunit alcohol dehydrogenase family)